MLNLSNTDMQTFCNITGNKKIYGFGVSNVLKLNRVYWNLEDLIYKFVDNNSAKWGIYGEGERKIPVISPEQMYREIGKEDIILIISVHYGEIINQLDAVSELDGISCYVLSFIGDYFDSTVDKELFRKAQSNTFCIPSVIHYFWFGKKEIPDEYKKYMETWHRYCPDYEIKRWDESNYDVLKHPYMKKAYELGMWAYVSDYARLDILYQHGGIYLDTDVELLRSLDELRKFQAFMGFESEQTVGSGLGMGAAACNDMVKQLRDAYDNYGCEKEIYKIPCPVHQTSILRKHGLRGNNSFQVLDGGSMVILPTEYLCGMRLHTHILQITANTVSVHHFTVSGRGLDEDENKKKKQLLKERERYNALFRNRVDFGI